MTVVDTYRNHFRGFQLRVTLDVEPTIGHHLYRLVKIVSFMKYRIGRGDACETDKLQAFRDI